jgi:hypothetical protein
MSGKAVYKATNRFFRSFVKSLSGRGGAEADSGTEGTPKLRNLATRRRG